MKKKIYYDIFIAVLSLVASIMIIIELIIALPDNITYILNILDNLFWIIFIFDYVIRLILSKNKLSFIKSNKVDLISIMPFNSIFQSLRIFRFARILKLARLSKLVRFVVLMYKFKSKADEFLKTNNFHYALIITIVTILAGAYGLSITEDKTLADSLWWSFVTATTVGYGDISPATNSGRIIAAMLMLVGIGFVGMLTGTIATYFLSDKKRAKSYRNEVIETMQEKLNNFDSLSKEDLKDMYKILTALKDQE